MACNGAYDYLQKYCYALTGVRSRVEHKENPYPDKIWTMWLQGTEQAPEIIKKCIATIQDHYGSEVIILTNKNINQFVDVPEFVRKKYQAGIISNTHYADVVRFLIVERYGGLWLDATTFLLDKIPDYIRFSDLFFYKIGDPKIRASIGVIAAKPFNPIIGKTANLMLEYWKHENKLVSYSISMLLLATVINSSAEAEKMWNSMPEVDCVNKSILLRNLFEKYDSTHLSVMKQLSAIQQLSWKFLEENYSKEGTFYDVLIKNNKIKSV